jgi:hypothetical protein
MKTKLVTIVSLALLLGFASCKIDSETPLPIEEEEKIYDGSIAYMTAKAYDNQTDTVSNPPQSQVVPTCNLNILADEVKEISVGLNSIYYAMDAKIPKNTSLKVVLRSNKIGIWGYLYDPKPENWEIEYQNYPVVLGNVSQYFKVKEAGKSSHLWISFFPSDEIYIDFYENENSKPSKTKLLKVKYTGNEPLINPVDSTWINPNID